MVRDPLGTTVVVPGSSANLGPGFDVLGMAVGRHVRMGLGVRTDSTSDSSTVLSDRHPARVAFVAAGGEGDVWFESDIPSGRGLGFSGAAIVAGTILGSWSRSVLSVDEFIERNHVEILRRATQIEGHADNVAASLYGGVVAVADDVVTPITVGFDARLVVWVPTSSTSTAKSRAALVDKVDRSDAVFNLGRVIMLAEGLRTGDHDRIRRGVEDRLHQEARLSASPMSRRALDEFVRHGAIAAWLSGSGPTVAALTTMAESTDLAAKVRDALGDIDGRVVELTIDSVGARQAT